MRKEMMNKKGDVTISTVILIILGLAVLVFLVIGLTQGWDLFFGNIETVDPGDLQILAKACVGYVDADLSVSFCEFKEIDTGGDDEFVNCLDGRIEPLVREETTKTLPSCTGENTPVAFCLRGGRISPTKLNTVKVNGQTCSQIGVSSAECNPKDGSKVVTSSCSCPVPEVSTVNTCNPNQICKSDGICQDPVDCTVSDGAARATTDNLACKCGPTLICDNPKKCKLGNGVFECVS